MSQSEHERARRELGFPAKRLRIDPHNWPDMAQSLDDDECF